MVSFAQQEVLKVVDLNEAWDLLPRLWSDLIMFNQAEREPILLVLLAALRKSQVKDAPLRDQLADVAWGIWQRGENQRESDRSFNRLRWVDVEVLLVSMVRDLGRWIYNQSCLVLSKRCFMDYLLQYSTES